MPVTYFEAIRRALRSEMERDSRVILLGEDIGLYGGAFRLTDGFLDDFGPDRVMDTPISEEGFTGVGVGAALAGFRPVVEFQFMDFIASAFNMVTNFAAKSRYRAGAAVPIVLRAPPRAAASAPGRSTRRTRKRISPTRRGSRLRRPRPRPMPRVCCAPRFATTIRCSSWSTSASTGAFGFRTRSSGAPRK